MYRTWLIKTVLLFGVAVVVVSAFYKFAIIDRTFGSIDYTLAPEVNTIAIGASHLEVGLDDTAYPNVQNFSYSGMPYFFTYAKTKKLLDNNDQINTVIISLSPIHISPFGDANLFTGEGNSLEQAFRYFPLLDETNSLGLRRLNSDFLLAYGKYKLGMPFKYIEDLTILAKSIRGPVPYSDTDYSGGYIPREKAGLSDDGVKEQANYYYGEDPCVSGKDCFSNYAILALKRTAELAAERGVALYIVTMPMHESFKKLSPAMYFEEQDRLIAELTDQYANITYVDYETFDLDNENFLDGDHVNVSGAKKLSEAFDRDIFSVIN